MRRQRVFGSASGVTLLAENLSTPARGMTTRIANTFNSGWQLSDIRRAYLADTDVGSVSGTELVVNGTFDTDLSNWVTFQATAWVSGAMRLQSDGNPDPNSYSLPLAVRAGAVYEITMTLFGSDTATRTSFIRLSTNGSPGGAIDPYVGGAGQSVSPSVTTIRKTLTLIPAGVTSVRVSTSLSVGSGASGAKLDILDVSVKEIIADRSYKNQSAPITGTLTKSQVA